MNLEKLGLQIQNNLLSQAYAGFISRLSRLVIISRHFVDAQYFSSFTKDCL